MGSSASIQHKYKITNQNVYIKDYMNCESVSELYKSLSWVDKKNNVYIYFDEDTYFNVDDSIQYFMNNKNRYKFEEQITILFLLWNFKLFFNSKLKKTIINCILFYSLEYIIDIEFVNIILYLQLDYFIYLSKQVEDDEKMFQIMKNWGDFFIDNYDKIMCNYLNYINQNDKYDKEIFKNIIEYVYILNNHNFYGGMFITIIEHIHTLNISEELFTILLSIDESYFNYLIYKKI